MMMMSLVSQPHGTSPPLPDYNNNSRGLITVVDEAKTSEAEQKVQKTRSPKSMVHI
jgi:hypothetical protein